MLLQVGKVLGKDSERMLSDGISLMGMCVCVSYCVEGWGWCNSCLGSGDFGR